MSYYQPNPSNYSQPYTQPPSYQPNYNQPPHSQPYTTQPYNPYSKPGSYQPVHEDVPLQAEKFTQQGWRDLPFACLFILHLIAFAIFTIIGSVRKLGDSNDQLLSDFESILPQDITALKMFIITIVLLALIGGVVSFMFLFIIRKFAAPMIYIAMVFTVVSWVALSIFYFIAGSIFMAILFGFFALISIFLFLSWRSRIPFAVEMLKSVTSTIEAYPATMYFSYLSILIQWLWVIWWAWGVNVLTHFSPSVAYFLSFFLLLSLYWVTQVIKNTIHVTCSGLFASWYFLRPVPSNPTLGSFKRATTTSFGSICLGSLLVAFLQTLRAIFRSLANQRNSFVAAIASCLIGCIESLVRYFNKYAFTQVAIYGKTYCQAAGDTWGLINSHGIEAIINDNLIGGVLTMCIVGAGIIGAIAGALLGLLLVPEFIILCGVFGFIIGFVMTTLTMEVVDSGVSTIFVCFALDPAALQRTEPRMYELFKKTYHNRCDLFN